MVLLSLAVLTVFACQRSAGISDDTESASTDIVADTNGTESETETDSGTALDTAMADTALDTGVDTIVPADPVENEWVFNEWLFIEGDSFEMGAEGSLPSNQPIPVRGMIEITGFKPFGQIIQSIASTIFRPQRIAHGLCDMAGNCAEWVADRVEIFWGYADAPTDGSAWIVEDFSDAVVRGGGVGCGSPGYFVFRRSREPADSNDAVSVTARCARDVE